MNSTLEHQTIDWDKRTTKSFTQKLIGEEPLSIRIQGNPYSVIMRTPGDEIPLVGGFCLGEGIVDKRDDFTSIAFCDDTDTNVIAVTVNESRRNKISEFLDRRGFISQTSCGICGKEVIEDLYQAINPLTDNIQLDAHKALECLERISEIQPLRDKTRGAHAAVLYNAEFKRLAVAEDVGRHNALDKAVGKLFLQDRLDKAALLILSSRISYELVQKSARARIPVILAISRPTSLAVELASKLNLTLACLADDTGLYIFCGEQRLLF